MPDYPLDEGYERERERLLALAAVADRWSLHHAEMLGLDMGWRIADVGAGAGTTAALFAAAVGPTGEVLATDVDARFLDAIDRPPVRVVQADIRTDPLPEGHFDLVHSRFLVHFLGTELVPGLQNMVAALRPGGWLLAASQDEITWGSADPPSPAVDKAIAALNSAGYAAGMIPRHGRRLLNDLCAAGLLDVRAEGHQIIVPGGHPAVAVTQLAIDQFAERLIAASLLTRADIEQARQEAQDPARTFGGPIGVFAWGRKASQ